MQDNSFWPYLIVGLGGFLGANTRYLVSLWFTHHIGVNFPYGTLFINVTGSLILGFFITIINERSSIDPALRLFVAIGFLGAYTTFSTFSLEVVTLIGESRLAEALLYAGGSLLLGILGVYLGIIIARLLA